MGGEGEGLDPPWLSEKGFPSPPEKGRRLAEGSAVSASPCGEGFGGAVSGLCGDSSDRWRSHQGASPEGRRESRRTAGGAG